MAGFVVPFFVVVVVVEIVVEIVVIQIIEVVIVVVEVVIVIFVVEVVEVVVHHVLSGDSAVLASQHLGTFAAADRLRRDYFLALLVQIAQVAAHGSSLPVRSPPLHGS
jgi:hypothetical protein